MQISLKVTRKFRSALFAVMSIGVLIQEASAGPLFFTRDYEVSSLDDSGGPVRKLIPSDLSFPDIYHPHRPSVSRHGAKVVFKRYENGLAPALIIADGNGTNRRTLRAEVSDYTAISPDGKRVAYSSGNTLHLIDSDGSNATRIESVTGEPVSFSPDGTRLLVRKGNVLSLLTISDSTVVQIGQSSEASWSPDSKKLILAEGNSLVISTIEGIRTVLAYETKVAKPTYSHDGAKIAFRQESISRSGDSFLNLMNSDGSGKTSLWTIRDSTFEERDIAFTEDGRSILFNEVDGLWRIDLNGTNLAHIESSSPTEKPVFSPADDTIAFFRIVRTAGEVGYWLHLINADSSLEKFLTFASDSVTPVAVFSEDGNWIYFVRAKRNLTSATNEMAVYRINRDGSGLIQISPVEAATTPVLQLRPGGGELCFSRAGKISIIKIDGSGSVDLALDGILHVSNIAYSADGSKIYFSGRDRFSSQAGLFRMNAGGGNIERLTDCDLDTPIAVNPSGTTIAYVRNQVCFLANPDGTEAKELKIEGVTAGDQSNLIVEDILAFTPDGSHLVAKTNWQERSIVSVDLAQSTKIIIDTNIQRFGDHFSFNRDGTKLAYIRRPIGIFTNNPVSPGIAKRITYALIEGLTTPPPAPPDKTAPKIQIATPARDSRVHLQFDIKGTAVDNEDGGYIDRVELALKRDSDGLYWTGSAWGERAVLHATIDGPNWTYEGALPADAALGFGNYTLAATATDQDGNATQTINRFQVSSDATSPVVTIGALDDRSFVFRLTRFAGTASDRVGVERVEYLLRRNRDGLYWNGSIWGARQFLPASFSGEKWSTVAPSQDGPALPPLPNGENLPDGKYQLAVFAYDAAGNVGRADSLFTVEKTSPALVTIRVPAHGSVVSAITEIRGQAADNTGGSGIARVDVVLRRNKDDKYWTGAAWGARAILATSRNGSYWRTETELPQGDDTPSGSYTISAFAYDLAGNYTGVQSNFTVALPGPREPVVDPTPSQSALSAIAVDSEKRSVVLTFTSRLDATTARLLSRYNVTINGKTTYPESATLMGETSVVLQLPEGELRTGDRINVIYDIFDAQKRSLKGSADVAAK